MKKCDFCGTEIANFGTFGRYLFACPNRNLNTVTPQCVSPLDRPSYYDKLMAAAEYEARAKEAKSQLTNQCTQIAILPQNQPPQASKEPGKSG